MRDRAIFCLKLLALILGFVVAGALLLGLVYLLPVDKVAETNMASSAETLSAEGTYPTITRLASSELDNFTDSLMLLKATYPSNESVFAEAMMNRSWGIESLNPQEALVAHYKDGKEFNKVESYGRYWHGYLIFLKPLAMIFAYSNIRIINCIVQAVLVAAFVVVLVKKKKKFLIIPFLMVYGFLMPLALANSLQFSSCFYVMMAGLFWLIARKKKGVRNTIVLFMVLGMLTAFFDFLTYPLITFGIPIIVYFLLDGNKGIKASIWNLIKLGVAWAVGYVGLWIAKWVVGSIITGQNLFAEGLSAVLFRTGLTGEEFSRLGAIKNNFLCFFATPMTILLIVFVAIMIVLIVVHWRNQKEKLAVKDIVLSLIPYGIIVVLPVVWFLFAANHSFYHYWFTNRICAISIFGLMCGLVKLYLSLKDNSRVK